MLVGGLAVAYWGEPRFTKDIDLSVYLGPSGTDALLAELTKSKFIFHKKEIMTLVKLSNRFAIADPSDTYRIDLWLPRTDFEKSALDRRLKKIIDHKYINLISPEDLILFKLLANRPQDLLDIQGILARQKRNLDEKYLQYWAIAFDKYKELDKLKLGY